VYGEPDSPYITDCGSGGTLLQLLALLFLLWYFTAN